MKRPIFYKTRKRKNKFHYELLRYDKVRKDVYIVEFYNDVPIKILLFPPLVFGSLIREAKLKHLEGDYDMDVTQMIEIAIDEFFQNKVNLVTISKYLNQAITTYRHD